MTRNLTVLAQPLMFAAKSHATIEIHQGDHRGTMSIASDIDSCVKLNQGQRDFLARYEASRTERSRASQVAVRSTVKAIFSQPENTVDAKVTGMTRFKDFPQRLHER